MRIFFSESIDDAGCDEERGDLFEIIGTTRSDAHPFRWVPPEEFM